MSGSAIGIRQDLFLHSIFEGAYTVDKKMRITDWNAAAENLTGFKKVDVLGEHCARKVVHSDVEGHTKCGASCPIEDTLRDGNVHEGLVYLRHREGHRVAAMVRAFPITDQGRLIGAVEVFTDNIGQERIAERIAELERLAMLDALTELPNRRYLEMILSSKLGEWERYLSPFGVLLIDIDLFKRTNDTYGHLVGDEAIRLVARTVGHAARSLDVVGRWGGEEFLAVVAQVDGMSLVDVGERLRSMVERASLDTDRGTVKLTVSAGAAMAAVGDDIPSLIDRTDRRLYVAKRGGRNAVVGPPTPERLPKASATEQDTLEQRRARVRGTRPIGRRRGRRALLRQRP